MSRPDEASLGWVDPGCQLCLQFDSRGSKDFSLLANPITPMGAINYEKEALLFNGSTTELDLGDVSWINYGNNKYTFCAYFFTDSTSRQMLLGKDSDSQGRQITLEIQGDAGEGGFLVYDVTQQNKSASGVFSTNTWAFIVFVRTGATTFDCYVNGAQVSDLGGNHGSVNDQACPLRVGSRTYSGNQDFFSGKLAKILIFNRELTATEIRNLYEEVRLIGVT